MKKLLTILSAITLVGTTSISVIACGSGSQEPINPTDDDGNNIQDLLTKTQDKINEGFGNLINLNKNLFFSGEFLEKKEKISGILEKLSSEKVTQINNDNFIKQFTQKIQNIINTNITNKLILDDNLRLLFNGISNNDVLKISVNKTNFFKIPFKWKKEENVNFGIKDYSPGALNIDYWYSIKINLNLSLSYKDENNKLQEKELKQDYIIYFANTRANIMAVIEAASLEINNKIKDCLLDIDITTIVPNKKNIIDKANRIIFDLLENNNKVSINESTLLENNTIKIKEHLYSEANYFYNAFNKSKTDSINYLKDYFQSIFEDFNTDLNKWVNSNSNLDNKAKSTIEKQKLNIKSFGKISLNNWTISGLTLKSINLDFITIRTNQTREQWIIFLSNALGNTFSLDGFIKIPFNIINDEKNLVMYMDKADFESYLYENKSLLDVRYYFNDKIKAKLIAEKVIQDTTEFEVTLNGCWNPVATLRNPEFVKKIDDSTLEVTKNPLNRYSYLYINIDGFYFIFGSKKAEDNTNGNNYITFNKWIIKKADSNIWN